jgi:hypothetical protein
MGVKYNSIYDVVMEDYKNLGDEMVWEMKDKTEIKIKDMKDSHVKNCIKMLNRNKSNETKSAWVDIFNDVLSNRRTSKLLKIKDIIDEKTKS